MKCPNCRCEVDSLAASCPYCGIVFTDRTRQRGGEPTYRSSAQRRPETRQTHTAAMPRPENRRPSQPTKRSAQKRQNHAIQINQETMIWLLIIIIVINVLQLAVLFFS